MLKGWRTNARDMYMLWMVPSTRWFSKIANWNEMFNWAAMTITTFFSVTFGVGFVVDPAIPDILGYIVFTLTALLSFPLVIMLLFGKRVTCHDLRLISPVEEAYNNMSKKDKRHYKSYLHAVYKDSDITLTKDVVKLFNHYAEPTVNETNVFANKVAEELSEIEEGKRIAQEAMMRAERYESTRVVN